MLPSFSRMDGHVAMLRRLTIVLLGLAWMAAWVQPCPCPAAAARAGENRHECCTSASGIGAADPDCCAPSTATAAGVVATSPTPPPLPWFVAYSTSGDPGFTLPNRAAALFSPPLRSILRV